MTDKFQKTIEEAVQDLTKALEHLDYSLGTFRDFLDAAEKQNLLSDVPKWMEIRELRNAIVHESSNEQFESQLKRLLTLTPDLLKIKGNINK